MQQSNRAIGRLQRDFEKPITVAELAAEAGMSVSAFHQHFKTITAMSPLQYQKQLRLQEARRLILSAALDAARAGHRVGYDRASRSHERPSGQRCGRTCRHGGASEH